MSPKDASACGELSIFRNESSSLHATEHDLYEYEMEEHCHHPVNGLALMKSISYDTLDSGLVATTSSTNTTTLGDNECDSHPDDDTNTKPVGLSSSDASTGSGGAIAAINAAINEDEEIPHSVISKLMGNTSTSSIGTSSSSSLMSDDELIVATGVPVNKLYPMPVRGFGSLPASEGGGGLAGGRGGGTGLSRSVIRDLIEYERQTFDSSPYGHQYNDGSLLPDNFDLAKSLACIGKVFTERRFWRTSMD